MKNLYSFLLLVVLCFSAKDNLAQAPNWTVNENAFNNNMSVITKLNTGCSDLNNPNNKVAAFFGSECRGVANTDQLVNGVYTAFLTIYSNSDQQVTFKFYDAVNNRIYDAVTTMMFKSDDIITDFTISASSILPSNILLSASTLDENVTNATIGSFSTNDSTPNKVYLYSLVSGLGDSDNASFSIQNGQLKNPAAFNWEVKNSYSIRVKANDSIGGCTTSKSLTISVKNVNEQPTSIALSIDSLIENTPANTVIATLSTVDPDTSTQFTYALVAGTGADDNALFTLTGKSLKINFSPNYEVKNLYKIRIKSTDFGGLMVEKALTVKILDKVNEAAPEIGSLANQIVCPGSSLNSQSLSIVDDSPASVSFTSSSSNTSLIPNSGIQVSGTGSSRQVQLTAVANQVGLAEITLIGRNAYDLTDTLTFIVEVDDHTAPVQPTLADVKSQCEVTSLTTMTTTDACSGTVQGTHNATLPYTSAGTYNVTWTFTDESGNQTTAIQKVIIADTIVPQKPTLANIKAQCEVAALTTMTTTDACSGVIQGTHNAVLPLNTPGTHTVTWTFTDAGGNQTTATQKVIIADTIAPVTPTLADVKAQCELTSLTTMTTTDACSGLVQGTHNATLPISGVGSYNVTWTFTDATGNKTTAIQKVVIVDTIVPKKPILPAVKAQCEVTSLFAMAASDGCAGTVIGTHNAQLPFTSPGTYNVTWTFRDPSGNVNTAIQKVIIADTIAPRPNEADLSVLTYSCNAPESLPIPGATDNCGGWKVVLSKDLPASIQPGTYEVRWTFTDSAQNSVTRSQLITFSPLNTQLTVEGNGVTVAEQEATYQWINCNDQQKIDGATQRTYTITKDGNYAVIVSKNGCADTSNCLPMTYSSIQTNGSQLQAQLYPNPASDQVSFQSPNGGSYTLINTLGQVVKEFKTEANTPFVFSVQNFTEGVYYLRNESVSYRLLIVNKK